MTTKELEAKMIAAHKEGVRCAKDGTLQAAAEWACSITYATQDERIAFAAGYQGELRRIAERRKPYHWRGTLNGV